MFRAVVAVLALSCGAFAQAAEYIDPVPLAEKITTPVGNVKEQADGKVRVPLITWGGDMTTILANGMSTSTQPGSLLADQGLNYELVLQDSFDKQLEEYISGKSPYLRCTIGMCNQAIDLLDKDPRTKPVVIYQLTWSRGGDSVVATNVMRFRELKGKTIAIQAYGPHVDFLANLLDRADMVPSDVKLRWMSDLTMSPNSPPEAFRDGDVDAAFTIIPDAYELTSGRRTGSGDNGSVKGARMIISTMFARRVIADVYVVRSDYFNSHRGEVRNFVRGLMAAEQHLHQLMENLGPDSKESMAMLAAAGDILLGDGTDQTGVENLYLDAEFVDREGNREFLGSETFEHRLPLLSEKAQRSFKAMGLIKQGAPLEDADWDFETL